MSTDRDDAHARPQPEPSGTTGDQHPARPDVADEAPAAGATAVGAQPSWDRPQDPPAWGQPQGDGGPWATTQPVPHPGQQPVWGQPAPPPHVQPGYVQPGWGQPVYGQPSPYGPYGPPSAPGRPGTVIAASVLGMLYGALGLLVALLFVAFGALVDDFIDAVEDSDPALEDTLGPGSVDSAQAGLIALGLVALAWAVVMVWGSVLALRGRSRVLLLVGTCIAVAVTGLVLLFGGIAAATDPESGGAGAIVLFLLVFLGTVATLVFLVVRPSSTYFAVHRQRRALLPR
jgi:hypothetical protein